MADNATWLSIALALTAVGGVITYLTWRSRGLSALLKGSGFTLVPLVLWSTGTLRLAGGIVEEVGSWASGFAFSPRVWLGLILAGVAVTLVLTGARVGRSRFAGVGARTAVSGDTDTRAVGAADASPQPGKPAKAPKAPKAPKQGKSSAGQPALDDDLADIEAILRDRGIS